MVKVMNLDIGRESNIYLMGDFHCGTKNFAEEELYETVRIIKKDRKAKVIIMGDLIEAILPDDKRFDFLNIDTKYNTTERQYHCIKRALLPIKEKVVAILEGNHDFTLKTKTGFDVPHILSHDLDAKYLGTQGLVKLSNKKSIFVTHGGGSSTTMGGQINKLIKLINNFKTKPDIVAMGHVHALQVVNNAHLKDDFSVGIDLLILTGSYYKTYKLGEENYASRRNYAPLPIGFAVVNVKKDGSIIASTTIL